MKHYIKRYNTFIRIENIIESLNLFEKDILASIKAVEVGFSIFGVEQSFLNIDDVYGDVEFNKNMVADNYKKSQIYNTIDYETFLESPIKFFFIFEKDKNELENPTYIVTETMELDKNSVKMFKVNDNIKNFYDKLTSKTIEIVDGDKKYVYQTSSSNEWNLKSNNANDFWTNIIRKDAFYKKIKSKMKDIQINLT